MSNHALIRVAALAVIGLLATRPVHADPPNGTLRYFGELNGPGDGCVNWESDGSKRIVGHRDQGSLDLIEFITPGGGYSDEDAIVRDSDGNVLLDLRSTSWMRTPVLHITDAGTSEVTDIYWLLEDLDGDGVADDPEPGITTPTGPDGEVMQFLTIRMTQAPATDLDNPNKFYLNANGSRQFCIALGVFNK